MASPKSCGPHVELAANAATRVTRCGCGTVHVTFLGSGVTVRMSADAFRNVAAGLGHAVQKLDDVIALGTTTIN